MTKCLRVWAIVAGAALVGALGPVGPGGMVGPAAAQQTKSSADKAAPVPSLIKARFSAVRLSPADKLVLEGVAEPGAQVTVTLDGRTLGRAVADRTGVWRLTTQDTLGVGQYRVGVSARLEGGKGVGTVGEQIRIGVAERKGTGSVTLFSAADVMREAAEQLAGRQSEKTAEKRRAAPAKKESAPPPGGEPPGGTRGAKAPPPPVVAETPRGPAPPPEPSTTPRGAPPRPAAPAAGEEEKYTAVPVLFGTDRKREADRKPRPGIVLAEFGKEGSGSLALGRAVVTVPKEHVAGRIELPWAVRVGGYTFYQQAENPEKHFTLKEVTVLTPEQFIAYARERMALTRTYKDQAFIFVHGYNVGFDAALFRTAQIVHDLQFDGVPFLYSWPSAGGVSWYVHDKETSLAARDHLRRFIDMVLDRTGAKHVHLIAHSMGNVPLLEVVRDVYREAQISGRQLNIRQIILAAPDVERGTFENIAREIHRLGQAMTLYASANDKALQASKKVGGLERAGDVPTRGPVVLDGLDTIDVTATSTDFLSLNHSSYAEKSALLSDIALILRTGERPPHQRLPILQPVKSDAGIYWRYPR